MSNEAAVVKAIKEVLGVNDAPLSARLSEDLKADSLDLVEVVMAIEDDLDIMLDDEEAVKCKTVDEWVKMVDKVKAG